jgi:Icc-related predicted phosphoesterase
MFCDRYPRVLYVPGNHEYYGDEAALTHRSIMSVAAEFQNLVVLDCAVREIDGLRFVGGTMWFEENLESHWYRRNLSDFGEIRKFVPWVYEENDRFKKFVNRELEENDIVVTHHLPSMASVHPQFAMSKLNMFFVCGMDELIMERKPRLWLHGHTHSTCDHILGSTRIVCNPFGYPSETKKHFNEKLIIEV